MHFVSFFVKRPFVLLVLSFALGILLAVNCQVSSRLAVLVAMALVYLGGWFFSSRRALVASVLQVLFFLLLGMFLAVPDAIRVGESHFTPNPDAPDYTIYRLLHQPSANVWPWQEYVETARSVVFARMDTSGLSEESRTLYHALLLGDRSLLPPATKELYRALGCSHLLALSGLHLSVLLSLLSFLFIRYVRYTRWWWVVLPLLLLVVWGYVLLAGAPPSLQRSAAMTTLTFLLAHRKAVASQLNALSLAALVILSFSPLTLYDVGFQMTFACMLGLIFYYEPLMHWMALRVLSRGYLRWAKPTARMLLMGMSCTLAASPLSIYYFQQFTLLGILLGPVLIPLTGVHLLLSLAVAACGQNAGPVSVVANWLVCWQHRGMQSVADAFAALSYQDVWLSPASVLFLVVMLVLAACLIHLLVGRNNPRRWLYPAIGMAICLSAIFVVESVQSTPPQLVFYYCRRCPAVHYIRSSRESVLLTAREDSVTQLLEPVVHRFWTHRLEAPPRINCNQMLLDEVGIRVALANDYRWCDVAPRMEHPMRVDYLWITRGYYGEIGPLLDALSPDMVVLDASLGRRRTELLGEQCDELGLNHYDMVSQGAMCVEMK